MIMEKKVVMTKEVIRLLVKKSAPPYKTLATPMSDEATAVSYTHLTLPTKRIV